MATPKPRATQVKNEVKKAAVSKALKETEMKDKAEVKDSVSVEEKLPEPEYVREELEELNEETPKAKMSKKEKKYRIIIDEQVGPDAHSEVFVGVNGKHYLIKRGHEVIVPIGVVNVLKEAVVTKIIRHEDGTEELRRIPRISFRVLGEV